MNVNQLNGYTITKLHLMKKKLSFIHYFDVFKAQVENLCKCHCNAPGLIFFDCGIMQRFDFSDKVPG